MFDHHTIVTPCQSAIDAMRNAFGQRGTSEEISLLEEPLYRLVGAPRDATFHLTSSSAEAIQQVLWSVFVERARKQGKTHFIASCIEDAPILQMLKRCEEMGCTIRIAPVDASGRIDLVKLSELITPRTALISLSIAHGMTGIVQPYEEIGRLAKKQGVLVHLDASWSLGKVAFSFSDLPVDYLTFSGEWIHSIQGSGGLFAKKGLPLTPWILGVPLNFPTLAALSAAARLAALSLDAVGLETARLRDLLEEELSRSIPELRILFREIPRLPNTTALLFPRVHHESLAYFLEKQGVYPNQSGHYCQKLSSVLAASSIDIPLVTQELAFGPRQSAQNRSEERYTESALSFSLSRMTTEEEVLKGATIIAAVVLRLHKLSEDLDL